MEDIETFSDFKLSNETVKALTELGFVKPTKVQLKAIPFCLKEKDVVVQAKTGSGKTLAFLVPIIEHLQKFKCNGSHGIQAIILVPTAELASQIITILSKLLKYSRNITFLSVVGGKAFTGKKEEWKNINSANILISTLGRLLEHETKNTNLDLSNMKYLIIDETDYLLEKNFLEEMDAVLTYLPKSRITWLFSATQISAKDELDRLSLNNPIFVGTESKEIQIPKNLKQTFMTIELQDKLQALWNLLEAQHNTNSIVFFSTQKQVLFMHRLFTAMHPSYKIVQLRSNMRLDKRVDSVNVFAGHKKGCVLFATDIASRGLDFPSVSLVIQYDLPHEFDDYVHRAGRTARFDTTGVSVLMVMPSEMAFLTLLKEQNIILKQIRSNVLKSQKKSIADRATIKYSGDLELFTIAKNAYLAYLRDYAKIPPRFRSFQETKDIFDVKKLPIKAFAKSLGFRSIPEETSQLGFLQSDLPEINVGTDQPFFTVKKILNNDQPNNKRRLEVVSDDDSESDEEQVETSKMEGDENTAPAFIFEEALAELQKNAKVDKHYYTSQIKPKYDRKKRRVADHTEDVDSE